MNTEQFPVVDLHLLWFQRIPRAGSQPEARHSQATCVRGFEASAELATTAVTGVCGRLRESEVGIRGAWCNCQSQGTLIVSSSFTQH